MNFGMLVTGTFLNQFLVFTVEPGVDSCLCQLRGPGAESFKGRPRLQDFVLAAQCVSWIAVEQLEWSGANCGMVRCVVGEIHGRQELFPIEGVMVDVGCQVFFDAFVEIFHLGIALWMSR